MPLSLRIILIIGAVLLFIYVLHKIRKASIQTSDTIFWLLSCVVLILLAVFPGISFFFADLLGIQSPSNFVYLFVIAVLILRVFTMSMEISSLRMRLNTMAQEIALAKKQVDDEDDVSSK